MASSLLLSLPHSSGFAPFHILADMLGEAVHDHEARQARLDHLFNEGDPYTDALFFVPAAAQVQASCSRFVVDLNRRRDAGGLNGVIKLTDFGGKPLYQEGFRFSEADIEERLRRYYDPFHAALDRMLAQDDIDFFIDGHSMSAYGPVIGPDCGEQRPAFTIMTGGDAQGRRRSPLEHTSISAELAQRVVALLYTHFGDLMADADVPETVLLNHPFGEGGTQKRLSDPAHPHAKPGFGLEFNRALFLEGEGGLDRPIPGRIPVLNTRFQAFVKDLAPLMRLERQQCRAKVLSH